LDKYERFKVAEALTQQTLAPSYIFTRALVFFVLFLTAHQNVFQSLLLTPIGRFKAGEIVLQEGESGNAFYIVKSGLFFLFLPSRFIDHVSFRDSFGAFHVFTTLRHA
jgi:hypothetical protein